MFINIIHAASFINFFRTSAFLVTVVFLHTSVLGQAQSTLVNYNFESDNQGWTTGFSAGTNGSWTRDNNSFSGADGNHWRTNPFNNYNNNALFDVTSATINASGYYNLTFSIQLRYQTRAGQDGVAVRYSIDNGNNWQRLGNIGDGTNWYNDTDVDGLANNYDGWSGNSGGWVTATIDLPQEVNNASQLRIQVLFGSDGNNTEDGFAFDNVVISGYHFASAEGHAPGGVASNLSLWLKADQQVKETSGIVTAWGDRSGNNNHAFQTNATYKPEYITDALNGNPVIYFEEGPYMDGTAGFYTQQYFIVLDPNEIYNSTNAAGRIIGFEPGGFSHLAFGPSTTYSNTEIITHAVDYTNGYRALQEDNVSNYGNPSLIVSQNNALSSPTGQHIYNNGLQVTSNEVNAGNFRNLSNQGYRLGDVFYYGITGYAPFNGRMAEVISYSSTLSSSQRRDVETYLAIKYGITLDINTQNYTVGGTSIYGNKNYPRDITGIGKNYASQGLNQTSSKSVNQGAIIRMSNPSDLDEGEYLVWGNDGGNVTWAQASIPAGNVDRLERTWYVSETGDVGTVDVSINLNQLGIDIDNSTVNLFQAPAGSSVPNTFSTATAHTNGVRSVNSEGQIIVTFYDIDFSHGEYFTLGGDIQTTSPGGVKDNLSMWFKADAGVSLSGSSVQRWADYSGNANDVYQGNHSHRPTYLTNEINFNPAIDFSSDYLDGIDGFYSHDYFVVVKPDAVLNRSNNIGAVLGFESGQFSALYLGLGGTGSQANEVITHNIRNSFYSALNSNTESYNSPLIINSKNNAAANGQELFVNGILKSNTSGGSFSNISNAELRIGNNYTGSLYDGKVAEIISYSARLTNAQRRDVETYLAIKYGITLDITSQSYTAGGTNIYNYTTHPNNIVGIAKNLDNGFNQTKSINTFTGAIVEISNGSSMNNGDYVVLGKDGGSTATIQTTELASQYEERIQAEFRVAVTGTPGTVTLKIYIGNIPQYASRTKEASFYNLLINSNGNFSTVNSAVAASALTNDSLVFHQVSFTNGDYFTLAIPATPSIGQNNSLWLRADKGLTLSGSEVTDWADQSGSGNHATRSGTGPTLVSNAVNGHEALDVSTYSLQGTAGLYTREYIIVAAPHVTYSSASNAGYLIGFETSQVSGLALGKSVSNWSDEVLTHLRRSTHRAALRGSASFSTPTIFNASSNNGATPQSLSANAYAQTLSTASTFVNLDNRHYSLGNSFTSAGAFNGTISEVLSFSSTQSSAEKRNIESYLALKYGITLNPSSHYTIDGTIVFNTTTFSGYTNDVIGIAAYAGYDFLQTSSSSVNTNAVLTVSHASSLNHQDFLVMGNDGGVMTSTTTGIPVDVGARVARKWAVQTTNSPGTVTLSFDLSGLGYSTKTIQDFSLILDANSDFTDGITRLQTPTSWSGEILTFTSVNLNGINYFSLGTAIDLVSDTDMDGIPNYFEIAYGTNPNNGNAPVSGGSPYTDTNSNTGINNDGISDALEKILISNGATGPITRYTDTDGDGIPDWIEVKNGSNPFNAQSPYANGAQDSDGDGLQNALENLIAQHGGTANASFTSDKDGDGVPDFLEIINNSNPNNANHPVVLGGIDGDGNGVSYAMEVTILAGGATGSVDKELDTDGDGIPDYIEAITYTDPFNIASPALPTNLSIRNLNADFTIAGGSCVDISGHRWINVLDQNGNLVFSINPVGNDLGATCYGIRIISDLLPIRTDGTHFLLGRNWWITPTNQPSGEKVYIRFYARNQETTALFIQALLSGIIDTLLSNDDFNQENIYFTKVGGINNLDPLVSGGTRSLLKPAVHSFGSTGKVFTLGVDGFSSFVAHSDAHNTPLPISLLYFKGDAINHKVEFNWATLSETNNDYFIIERSENGLDFEPIQRIKGAGHSTSRKEYKSYDYHPLLGASYYRLKQVDFDGQYTYSEVISVMVAGVDKSVYLYPNPTKEKIMLYFETDLAGIAPHMALYELSGRKCRLNINREDANQFVLDVSHLPSGIYLLEIIYRGDKVVKTIIKE